MPSYSDLVKNSTKYSEIYHPSQEPKVVTAKDILKLANPTDYEKTNVTYNILKFFTAFNVKTIADFEDFENFLCFDDTGLVITDGKDIVSDVAKVIDECHNQGFTWLVVFNPVEGYHQMIDISIL